MRRFAPRVRVPIAIALSLAFAPLALGEEESREERLSRCRRELKTLEKIEAQIIDLPTLRLEQTRLQDIVDVCAPMEEELARLRAKFLVNEKAAKQADEDYREFWYGDRERSGWSPRGWARHAYRWGRAWAGPLTSSRWRRSAAINKAIRDEQVEGARLRRVHGSRLADLRRRLDPLVLRPIDESETETTTLGGKVIRVADMSLVDCKKRLDELATRIPFLEGAGDMTGVTGVRWPVRSEDRPRTLEDAIAYKRAEIASLERGTQGSPPPSGGARPLKVRFFPTVDMPPKFKSSLLAGSRAAQIPVSVHVRGLPVGVHQVAIDLPECGRYLLYGRAESGSNLTLFGAWLPLTLGQGGARWRITTLPGNAAGASGRWEYGTAPRTSPRGPRGNVALARQMLTKDLARVRRKRTRASVSALASGWMGVAHAHVDLHEFARADKAASEARRTIDSVRDPNDRQYYALWMRFCALQVAYAFRAGPTMVDDLNEWATGYLTAWDERDRLAGGRGDHRERGAACLDIAQKLVLFGDLARARQWARRGLDEFQRGGRRIDWSDSTNCPYKNLRAALNLR